MEDSGNVAVDTTGWLCCVPCWWLRRNSSVHRATVSVSMLLIMSLLVASPVLFLISTAPSASRPQDCTLQEMENGCTSGNDDVCETSECRGAAGRLETALSWRVDPCEDFYGFACGGWHKHQGLKTGQAHIMEQIQHLLEEKTRSGTYNKLGDFHRSCLKARTNTMTSQMLTLLDDLGGYVSTDEPDPPDLSSLLEKLFRLNGDPLFDVYVGRELQNYSRPALFVDLPRRLKYYASHRLHTDYQKMFHSGWYVHRGRSDGCRYRVEGSRMFVHTKDKYEESRQLIMENLLQSFVPENSPSDESQNILKFASLINKSNPRTREYHDIYTEYNVNQLQRLYEFVQWIPLLREALNVNVTSDDVIYIMAPTYMSNIARTLHLFHPRTVHNALLVVYATDMLTELVKENERTELCTKVAIDMLPDAVSSLYVSQYSQQALHAFRIKISNIITNVKNTLRARIRSVTWMDERTKAAALQKVSSLRIEWPELINVTTILRDVEVDPNNFFQNVIKRNRQMRNFNEHYYESASLKRWTFPFLVNTFYDATLNSIVIPLAALTQTYFHNNLPQYIPYGMMGMVFSHGILHGFDLVGTEYDETGSKISWMPPETKLRLQARLECIVKQYSTMIRKEVDFTGNTVDVSFEWNVTRNENMADISGLHVAYETWHNLQKTHPDPRLTGLNLSPPQLFFLHSGQVLCSDLLSKDAVHFQEDFNTHASERVNSIMMNSVEFAEAFSCTAGRKMNPSKKCSLF